METAAIKHSYSRWRHGGWYVHNVRYPSGAIGCVSNNYDDKKWRIACSDYYDTTFPSRDAAASAERLVAMEQCKSQSLLDALQETLRVLVTPDGFSDRDKGRTAEQQAAFDNARNAIAKAKGGAT